MEKYTNALEILFKHVSVHEIIKNQDLYRRFKENTFVILANKFIGQYSNNEIENLFDYFNEEYVVNQRRLFGNRTIERSPREYDECANIKGLKVFDILLSLSERMLLEEHGEPVCNYRQLLRWRMSAHQLEEDFFITAFLAYKDLYKNNYMRDFRWDLVIKTNNKSLHGLLNKGMAENHFHLKGSAPYFHLSWLSLMNRINSNDFARIWNGYEERRLNGEYEYNETYKTYSLSQLHRQAALIRLILFMKLRNQKMVLDKVKVKYENIKMQLNLSELFQYKIKVENKEDIEEILDEKFAAYESISLLELLTKINEKEGIRNCNSDRENESSSTEDSEKVDEILYRRNLSEIWSKSMCSRKDFLDMNGNSDLEQLLRQALSNAKVIAIEEVEQFLPNDVCRKIEEEYTLKRVYDILEDTSLMNQKLSEIQILIETQRQQQALHSSNNEKTDYALSGVSAEYIEQDNIRNILMGERWLLYQMFQKYFYKDNRFNNYFNLFYLYLVIKEKIRSEMIQVNSNVGFSNFAIYQARKEDFIEETCFERDFLKLAVADSMRKSNLVSLESRISPKNNWVDDIRAVRKYDRLSDVTEEERERMFYVYHFVKELENEDEIIKNEMCHHQRLRNKVKRQALAISRLREQAPEIAQRILGIDGCNVEIGCRPEVFAVAFRYLKNYVPIDAWGKKRRVPKLGVTYHVGEDFLDIIDGLRAIEEAYRFLEFRCGDRMGHALALGINVRDWYESKMRRVVLPKQDYLDNLVWVYTKIRQNGMVGFEDLLLYIEKEYAVLFQEIYLNNIAESYMHGVFENYRASSREKISERISKFDIHTYYYAWKLRGDDPEAYRDGFFKFPLFENYGWDMFRIARSGSLEDFRIKDEFEPAFLYHNYHYNGRVKRKGKEIIEVSITPQMMDAVEKIQLNMQKRIAEQGIEIETNPSSNYLIGTFKRYDQHPLLKFYNLGLERDQEKIADCPQISVSINTDDQGVFATSLENEYALMAQALERMCDSKGNQIYSREEIYQWLDRIRKNGIQQSFLCKEKTGIRILN